MNGLLTEIEDGPDRRHHLKVHPLGVFDALHEIRTVEDRIQQLFNDGHVRGSTHLAQGQEAVSVGVALAAELGDSVTCTYRGHATALALGLSPRRVLGEIVGRTIGCAGGVGGSMHLVGRDVGLFPTYAIVGAGIPIATGAALTAQVTGSGAAAIAMFGDGACNIGAFHEALNFAAIRRLPCAFVIENNLYGEYSRIDRTTPVADLARRADAYDIPGMVVDGQDVGAVADAVGTALSRARAGDGPTLIEAKTYRYSGHSRSDPATYRPTEEVEEWKARDPLMIHDRRLVEAGSVTAEELQQRHDRIAQAVEGAVAGVLASPPPDPVELTRHITAEVGP